MDHEPRLLASSSPVTRWLKRTLLVAAALVFAVTAFFFITVALVAGTLLALVIGVRWWWLMRRLRAQAKTTAPLEGEYTVISRQELEAQRFDR